MTFVLISNSSLYTSTTLILDKSRTKHTRLPQFPIHSKTTHNTQYQSTVLLVRSPAQSASMTRYTTQFSSIHAHTNFNLLYVATLKHPLSTHTKFCTHSSDVLKYLTPLFVLTRFSGGAFHHGQVTNVSNDVQFSHKDGVESLGSIG